jgi:hypothetical protein
MKAHDLSTALRGLSQLLKRAPNVPIEELEFVSPHTSSAPSLHENAPVALGVLVKLAEYGKPEWVALISELGLNVPIKKTDSTRDLIGRLLKYISENDDAMKSITSRVATRKSNVSPELINALTILMKK